jgi:predicted ATPase
MITEIQLERFKKFETLRVKLSPFSVLMGENSSGKTSILQALNLALVTLNSSDLLVVDSQSQVRIRPKGIGLTALPGIELSDFRELYFGKKSRASSTEKWVGANIVLVDEMENKYRLQVTSLFGGFNIKCNSNLEDFPSLPALQNKPPLLISGFVGLSSVEERVFPVALIDRLRSGHVSSVIRNLIFDTKQNSSTRFDSLVKRLAKDFDFHLDTVRFNQEKDLYVTAQYMEACNNRHLSLDFNASGSGFMQVLQILAPIYRFCPDNADIVLLDEPDAHLHPNLQTTLANSLRTIQQELGIQIIISTHSTSIIRSASPTEVIPISSHGNVCHPLTTRKDIEEHVRSTIDSYDLAKSVISGKLAFFEDSDLSLWQSLDDVLDAKLFSGATTVPIVSGRGKTDRVPFQIRDVLAEFTDETIEIVVVRDGDGLPPVWRTKLQSYAGDRGVTLCILENYELESYLLFPEVFQHALRKKNEESRIPSIAELEEQVTQALRDTIALSRFHYDDCLEEEVYQLALLMNLAEYRNFQTVKSEVRDWHGRLESLSDLTDLRKYGQGKEALKAILRWLNEERSCSISKADLIASLPEAQRPAELDEIMSRLRSKDARNDPEPLEDVITDEDEDEVELRVQEVLQGFGE